MSSSNLLLTLFNTSTPSSQESSPPDPFQQFHLFPLLPPELRLKIWSLFLFEPRTLNLTLTLSSNIRSPPIEQRPISKIHTKPSTPPSPLLSVNHESRHEALRVNLAILKSERWSKTGTVYFNPRIDVLLIRVMGMNMEWTDHIDERIQTRTEPDSSFALGASTSSASPSIQPSSETQDTTNQTSSPTTHPSTPTITPTSALDNMALAIAYPPRRTSTAPLTRLFMIRHTLPLPKGLPEALPDTQALIQTKKEKQEEIGDYLEMMGERRNMRYLEFRRMGEWEGFWGGLGL